MECIYIKGWWNILKERFIKKTHYLDYQFDEHTDIKLGFTTRENGLSPYPCLLYTSDAADE